MIPNICTYVCIYVHMYVAQFVKHSALEYIGVLMDSSAMYCILLCKLLAWGVHWIHHPFVYNILRFPFSWIMHDSLLLSHTYYLPELPGTFGVVYVYYAYLCIYIYTCRQWSCLSIGKPLYSELVRMPLPPRVSLIVESWLLSPSPCWGRPGSGECCGKGEMTKS